MISKIKNESEIEAADIHEQTFDYRKAPMLPRLGVPPPHIPDSKEITTRGSRGRWGNQWGTSLEHTHHYQT